MQKHKKENNLGGWYRQNSRTWKKVKLNVL